MSKEKDILIKLGNNIGRKAQSKFKSNVEFSNVADVTETTIRRVLLGKQNISIKLLEQICDALDVKMSDLLKEIGK